MKKKPQQIDKNNGNGKLGVNLLELGIEFGLLIAVPLILLLALGFYLDKTFGTVPLFILIGLFLSICISSYMLYKKINPILLQVNNKQR
jgi:F0F1-type ATP synthase assembly protein I